MSHLPPVLPTTPSVQDAGPPNYSVPNTSGFTASVVLPQNVQVCKRQTTTATEIITEDQKGHHPQCSVQLSITNIIKHVLITRTSSTYYIISIYGHPGKIYKLYAYACSKASFRDYYIDSVQLYSSNLQTIKTCAFSYSEPLSVVVSIKLCYAGYPSLIPS